MARSSVVPGRFTAQREGAFVVFVIGMRINKLWQVWKWLPTARAMGPMIRELLSTPGSGLQHYEMMRRGRTVVLLAVLGQLRAAVGLRPQPRPGAPAGLAGVQPTGWH
ncbi:MAG: DUF4188 domain-containing protein [Acidimicrobiales bacterium]